MHTSVILDTWLCCMYLWCGKFCYERTDEQGDSRSRMQKKCISAPILVTWEGNKSSPLWQWQKYHSGTIPQWQCNGREKTVPLETFYKLIIEGTVCCFCLAFGSTTLADIIWIETYIYQIESPNNCRSLFWLFPLWSIVPCSSGILSLLKTKPCS